MRSLNLFIRRRIMDAPWKLPNALVQLQTRYHLAAKPHPKIACLLQRSLDRRGSKARLIASKPSMRLRRTQRTYASSVTIPADHAPADPNTWAMVVKLNSPSHIAVAT